MSLVDHSYYVRRRRHDGTGQTLYMHNTNRTGSHSLALTPQGHLRLDSDAESPPLAAELAQRLAAAFERGAGHGLLQLGAREVGAAAPPVLVWWRDFAARYVTALCATPEDALPAVAALDDATVGSLVDNAPPMRGAEYLSPEVIAALWTQIDVAARAELAESKLRLPELLKSWHPAWNLVGRVHFNLAENRKDPEAPFAFLATYTTRLSAHGKAQHLPLSAGAGANSRAARNKAQLLSLLLPVQRAARAVRLAARDGRGRRDLSPAALDARRSAALAARRAEARGEPASSCACPAPGRPAGRRGRWSRPVVGSDAAVAAGAWTRCSISAWRSRWTASRSPRPRSRRC